VEDVQERQVPVHYLESGRCAGETCTLSRKRKRYREISTGRGTEWIEAAK
jgi:hypothetical protein